MKIRRIDFYPADWLEGCISLTHEERSVYITVCACIYARGGPVEIAHARKFCPGHGFKRGLEGLIRKRKLTQNGLELDSKRTELELSRARARTERGPKKPPNVAKSNVSEFTNKQHTTTNIQHASEERIKERNARAFDPRFVRWWEAYPEKVGKGAAEAAYLKALKKGATEEELLEGVRRYVEHKPKDRPYCNPATWLNQERWNDGYPNGIDAGVSQHSSPSEAERQSALSEILDDLKRRGFA